VTVSGLPGDDGLAALQPAARPDVAGLPPWTDELPGPEPGTLPPWEAGPWPSHESPNHEPDGPGPALAAGASGATSTASGPDWAAAPRPGAGPWIGSAQADGGATGAGSRAAGGSPADGGAAGAAPGTGPRPGASSGTGPAGRAPWGASPADAPARWAAPAADTVLDAFPPARSPDPAGLAAGPVLAPDGQRGRPDWPVQDARPARDPKTGPAAAGLPTAGPVTAGLPTAGPAAAGRAPAGPAPGNPLAAAALVAGIFGIAVLPGVILGVLGLRRASVTGTGRLPSWLGIALSLLWAAGIIILALPGPGAAADPGCAQYRAAGSAAVARVTAALAAKVPAARLHADLALAGDAVNGAAATAQSIEVRNTLGALGGALQSEQAAAPAGRLAPAALGPVLARDAAAARQLCGASS
jgi:hypothetical protein